MDYTWKMFLSSCGAIDNCSCARTLQAVACHLFVRLIALHLVPMQLDSGAYVSSGLRDDDDAAAAAVGNDLSPVVVVVGDDECFVLVGGYAAVQIGSYSSYRGPSRGHNIQNVSK